MDKKLKKALFLCNSSAGLYEFRSELLRSLADNGYEIHVSCPDRVKTDLLEGLGCKIIPTDIDRRGVNPMRDVKLILFYRKLVRKLRPDIVLTYTIKPNVYGGFICGRAGVPYISTITGLGTAFQKEGLLLWLVQLLYRTGLKKAACVFFQNTENRELFHTYGLVSGQDRLVSGSGVNLEDFRFLPYPKNDETRFLFVGRVMQEKGIDEYFAAADALSSGKVTFSIAGYCDDDYQEKLDAKVKQGSIRMLGLQKDMHPVYERCSAVVLPTWHEGMSNVLMESSACGRPVIASNISGCREIFENGVTGFGFAPKSSQDLIRALREFLRLSRSERAVMGESARRKMEREFDRRKVVAAYMEEIGKAAKAGNA